MKYDARAIAESAIALFVEDFEQNMGGRLVHPGGIAGSPVEIATRRAVAEVLARVEAETEPVRGTVVPDLREDVIDHGELETIAGPVKYKRRSVANATVLYYVAEHDRETGVGMDEVMREFSMGVGQQGALALSMKDATKLGYTEVVSPRGDPYRWRITEKGLEHLGMPEAVPDPSEHAEADRAYMVDAFGMGGKLPSLPVRGEGRRPGEVIRTASGRELSDADIEELADEAERGYDVERLKQSQLPPGE